MLTNLTGIRGIAALWVFGLHYNEYFAGILPSITRLNFVLENGRFGVDLFFCLSGFILGYVYFDEMIFETSGNNLKHFLYKRLARLYPIYFVTLSVATMFYIIAILTGHEFEHESSSNISLPAFIQNLIGVQTWFRTNSLNGPAWSVSAEFAAYLTFPILVYFLRKSVKYRNGLSLGLLILSICVYEFSLDHTMLLNREIIQVLTEFTMGLCVYLLVRDLEISEKLCKGARKFVFFILLLSLFLIHSTIILSSVIPPLLLISIALNFFYNIPGKGLSSKFLFNLGLWSYSLYMTHRLFQNIMSGLSLPLYDTNLIIKVVEFLVLLFIPIFTSFITTKYLENPTRRYLLNLWK